MNCPIVQYDGHPGKYCMNVAVYSAAADELVADLATYSVEIIVVVAVVEHWPRGHHYQHHQHRYHSYDPHQLH